MRASGATSFDWKMTQMTQGLVAVGEAGLATVSDMETVVVNIGAPGPQNLCVPEAVALVDVSKINPDELWLVFGFSGEAVENAYQARQAPARALGAVVLPPFLLAWRLLYSQVGNAANAQDHHAEGAGLHHPGCSHLNLLALLGAFHLRLCGRPFLLRHLDRFQHVESRRQVGVSLAS